MTHFFGWFLTVLVVSTVCLLTLVGSHVAAKGGGGQSLNAEYMLTGELIIGLKHLGVEEALLQPQMAGLVTQTPAQSMAKAILLEQIRGPEAGIQALESITLDPASSSVDSDSAQDQQRLLELVNSLMFAQASGAPCKPLEPEASEFLAAQLPFYGPFLEAQATGDTESVESMTAASVRLLFTLFAFVLWYVFAFLAGLIGLILIVILALKRAGHGAVPTGIDLRARTGSVYIETFGFWLLAFFGLSFLAEYVFSLTDWNQSVPELNLVGSMIAMFASLCTLYWPRLRGIDSPGLFTQLGLARVNLIKEMLCGVLIYATAIPLLVIGLGLSALLGWIIDSIFGAQPAPSHPVTDMLAGSTVNLVLIYLLACVAAPIVEEIMFRGVLYRYLREVSRFTGFIVSFSFAALVSSLIFAAIHPQGISFIPVLGALAVAFCIGREWRGSLIAPIVAHGINNLVTVTLGMLLLG
ncbi:MAG: CPBP family intramembrane glutamic endopeptidase [Planctomycetota bacterium]|nr:CPBP family intramembrane glutamic endopeptidase [Planctomycetota bacterium]